MTKFTRWLILLSVGTLLFGALCFGSGLLLGLYLGHTELPGAVVAVPSAAPAVAVTRPGLALPATPALQAPALPVPPALPSKPAISVQPGGVQVTPPTAGVLLAAPKALDSSAGAPTGAAPATAMATPAAPAAASPAVTAAGTAAAFPVRPVADLQVGVPADEEPASELRGSLVSGAETLAAASTQHPAPDSGLTAPPGNGAAPSAGPAAATSAQAAAGQAPTPVPARAEPPKRAFAVRVGAYLEPGAAQRRAGFLHLRGYQPLVLSSRQPEEGLTWYSVVLGQANDLAAARRQAEQFEGDQQQHPEIVSWSLVPGGGAAGAPPPGSPAK